MIRLPHRSVTRFFIPMIDVLTLLFCIYLLMPPDQEAAARRERRSLGQQTDTAASRQSDKAKEKGKRLMDRLFVRVLEIDARSGKLYYRDPERKEVRNERDAFKLIEHDRETQGAKRELLYMVLYPRIPNTGYPTVGQKADYERWFKGVALGYDVPGQEPERKP